MKLKVKNFDWLAGRPVVILNSETAKKLNVHVDDRVSIALPGKKINAVIDIFPRLVEDNEIGLSREISMPLKIHSESIVEVSASSALAMGSRIIKRKFDGEELSAEDLQTLISEIVKNNLTEAEIAYFVAAEKLQGMTMPETIALTEAMVNNGARLDFGHKIVADKHCIGGIAGNRTTPIVVSICAAAGLIMPKTSSRAITSASGTADVVETVTCVEFSTSELKKIVEKTGACLAWGGGLGLAPSDDKIISVERLLKLDAEPQLIASIMSKKIAAGSNRVLIDIPCGATAKVKTRNSALSLARKFKEVAKHFGMKLDVVITDGKQPIGNGFGPVLEMLDVVAVLSGRRQVPDLRQKALFLASQIMKLCGIRDSRKKAEYILDSSKAYEKFKQIVAVQDEISRRVPEDFDEKLLRLKPAQFSKPLYAEKSGTIVEINNKKVNSLARMLGTPETVSAGVYLHKHLGKVKKGEQIMTLYSESKEKLADGLEFIRESPLIIIK